MEKEDSKKLSKTPRGRSVKNIIKPINTSPEEIAKAISLAADKKLQSRRKIKA